MDGSTVLSYEAVSLLLAPIVVLLVVGVIEGFHRFTLRRW
jgi:hypothetical protein